MNRIFHARITLTDIVLLSLISGMSIWLLWNRMAVLALLFLVLMVIVTEKMIHTTYTITTDGSLIIYKGRFLKIRQIALEDIQSVSVVSPFRIFGKTIRHYVLIECSGGMELALLPKKEDELIEMLGKRCLNLKFQNQQS